MAKALSKSQIATEIATKNNLTKKTAVEILEFLAELAYKNAKNTFTIPGLGKLVLVNRKARVGRNPNQPDIDVPIPSRATVKFKAGKVMRQRVLLRTEELKSTQGHNGNTPE